MISIILTFSVFLLIGKALYPLLRVVSNDDAFQHLNNMVYLGMGYVFSSLTILSTLIRDIRIILVLSLLVILFIAYWKRRDHKITTSRESGETGKNFLILIIGFSTLLYVGYLSSTMTQGYAASTADDAAFHTFLIRLIIDNPGILLTGSSRPYANFYVTYPLLPHVVSAFLTQIRIVSIERSVIMLSSTLPAMISLSLYSTAKYLFKDDRVSIIAMILSFSTLKDMWVPIGWGGLPYLFSVYYTITNIGLITNIMRNVDNPISKAIGVLSVLSISLYVYPVVILYTSFWFLIELVVYLVYNRIELRNIWINRNSYMVLSALTAFNLPFFLRLYNILFVIDNSNYPHDVIIPSNLYENVRLVTRSLDFNIFFDLGRLSLLFKNNFSQVSSISPLVIYVLLASSATYILNKKLREEHRLKMIVEQSSKLYMYFLMILSYLRLFQGTRIGEGYLMEIIPILRVFRQLSLFSVLFPSIILYFLLWNLESFYERLREDKAINLVYLTSLTIIGLMISYPIFNDELIARQSNEFRTRLDTTVKLLERYSVVTESDLRAMRFIESKIPSDAVFLVSASDAGQYLTPVTGRDSVHEFSLQLYSESYQRLLRKLNENPVDEGVLKGLKDFNISYIYIGSKNLSYNSEYPFGSPINKELLLSCDPFEEVYSAGGSTIIKVIP